VGRVTWCMWYFVYALLILAEACSRKTTNVAETAGAPAASSVSVKSQELLFHLELASPILIQPLESAAGVQPVESKFVEIQVVNAMNPKRYPVTVQVDYEPSSGARVHLGSFSLFPSDSPGKFIVPTKGQLQKRGAIVLSLQRPERAATSDTVRIAIRRIALLAR
jgi:hypothetical protein